MVKATELYPLPEEERRELLKATVLSEVIIIAVALPLIVVLFGLVTGDWLGALAFHWVFAIAEKMTFHWLMLVLPCVLIGIVIFIDRTGMARSESYRKAKLNLAQGLNGELPRLKLGDIALVSILAGVCEELLFRYALMGLLLYLLSLLLEPLPVIVLTVVIATAAFTLIHLQYRDLWSVSIVVCLGLLLCIGYIVSGSLLVVMFSHAVYDAAIMLFERHNMIVDADYFGGKVPNNVALELSAQQKEAKQMQTPSDTV